MKKIMFMTSLATAMALCGVAFGNITVDFGSISGSQPLGATSSPLTTTSDGTAFSYQSFSAGAGAFIDSSGVSGTSGADGDTLTIDFAAPANALTFDFAVKPYGPLDTFLNIRFLVGPTLNSDWFEVTPSAVAEGDGYFHGSVDYHSPAGLGQLSQFNQAVMYFNLGTPDTLFKLSNMTYALSGGDVTSPVPVPGAVVLGGLGLSLAAWARRRLA